MKSLIFAGLIVALALATGVIAQDDSALTENVYRGKVAPYYVLFRLTALRPKPNGTDEDNSLVQLEPLPNEDDVHEFDLKEPELKFRRERPTAPTARPTRPPRPRPPPISLAHGNITLSARTKNNQTLPAIGGHINGLITGGKIYRVLLPANLSDVAGIGLRVDVPQQVASRVIILSRPVIRIVQPFGQRALLVRESNCSRVTPGSDYNFRRPRPRPRPTHRPRPSTTPAPPPPPTSTPPPAPPTSPTPPAPQPSTPVPTLPVPKVRPEASTEVPEPEYITPLEELPTVE